MASEMKGKSKYVARQIRATKRAFEAPKRVVGTQEERVRGLAKRLQGGKQPGKKKKGSKRGSNYSNDHRGTGLFSSEDEYELMCQGVNPWDDDAAVSSPLWEMAYSYIVIGYPCRIERRLLLTAKT